MGRIRNMGDYPESQPNSQPCSPVSVGQHSVCSDVSSPSEPPSFNAGTRLCWNGSGTPPRESPLLELAPPQSDDAVVIAVSDTTLVSENRADNVDSKDVDVRRVHIQTVSVDIQDPSNAPLSWVYEDVDCRDPIESGIVSSTFESVYPLESGASIDTIGDSQAMLSGDCQLWPLAVNFRDQCNSIYLPSIDAEYDYIPDLPGTNSRARDMVLSPFNGPNSVVRGVETLEGARRLAPSIDSQEVFIESGTHEEANRKDDADIETLPTAAEWRRGLDVLHKLRAELVKERSTRNTGDEEGVSITTEVDLLRRELKEESDACAFLKERVARCESAENAEHSSTKTLMHELNMERSRVCAEREKTSFAEAALRDQEDNLAQKRGSLKLEGDRFGTSQDCSHLTVELAVASAQEAAATAVATHLRAELVAAERRIHELERSNSDSEHQTNLEEICAVWSVERAELRIAVESSARAEMEEFATVARLRTACDALQSDLNAEMALADVGRLVPADNRNTTSGSDNLSVSLQAASREHGLHALAACEQQLESDRARLESEKQVLQARVDDLSSELANQGSGHSQHTLDAETRAARLMEENRRLQCELLTEFRTAVAAAVEASTAASVAASSVAALKQESLRNLPQNSEVDMEVLRYSPAKSRNDVTSPVEKLCSSLVFHSTPIKRSLQVDSPSEWMRVPRAGDGLVCDGSGRRIGSNSGYRSLRTDVLKNEVGSKDNREFAEDDGMHSPLSKPFLGGPLGLARALAMRSTPQAASKSPVRRLTDRHA